MTLKSKKKQPAKAKAKNLESIHLEDFNEAEIDRLLAEKSLHEFVQQAWHIIEPGQKFCDNWHIEGICLHLQAVSNGEISQLLINVPPGTMKSLLTNVFWPAWVWTKHPEKRLMFSSYAEELSMRDSVKCRNLILSEWYQDRWPTSISADQNTKGKFQNTKGGWRMVGSIGGKGIGEHPDYNCCFPAGTMIKCAGGIKSIETIKVGDSILSFNHETGKQELQKALRIFKRVGERCIKIRTATGKEFQCTPNHPIFIYGKGYKKASEIQIGEQLMATKELPMLRKEIRRTSRKQKEPRSLVNDFVISVEPGDKPNEVFNIEVEGNNNYFAEGILVHNCDDPHNVKQAESEQERRNVIDWLDGTFSTRGVSRGVRKVLIMQRLHSLDASGHLLSKGGWVHICLPMRFEIASEKQFPDGSKKMVPRMYPTSIDWNDPRKADGELLWPELYPSPVVDTLEVNLGIYHAAGQLQQRPAPRGGGTFKRVWFEIIQQVPSIEAIVRYWDKSGVKGGSGAQTSGVLIARYLDSTVQMKAMRQKFIILDVITCREAAAEREALIKQTAMADKAKWGHVTTWAEQEPGSGGKESAEGTIANLAGYSVKVERVTGSKEVRADPLASQASVGKVKILIGHWNQSFLDELEHFPVGKLKDQVDAAGGGFNKLNTPTGAFSSTEGIRVGQSSPHSFNPDRLSPDDLGLDISL